jgi:hypothetical protein
MSILRTIIAAAFAVTAASAAHADGLRPIQGQSIDLGAMSGTAYYTVERGGFHVVATLVEPGEAATPVRVETLLAPGQSVTLSTLHGAGVAPEAVEIVRQADTVVVRKATAPVTN